MDNSGIYPKRYTAVLSGSSSSSILFGRNDSLFTMRNINEKYFSGSFLYYFYVVECPECDELGELTIQLEELGIQLREQFRKLEQFSIQLEKQ
jgi:hypothetical protein